MKSENKMIKGKGKGNRMKRIIIYVTILAIALCSIISGFTVFSSGCFDTNCPPTVTPFVPTDTASPSDTPVPSDTPEPTETPQPTATATTVSTATVTPPVPVSDPTPTDVPRTDKNPEPTASSTPNMVMPDTGPFDEYIGMFILALVLAGVIVVLAIRRMAT